MYFKKASIVGDRNPSLLIGRTLFATLFVLASLLAAILLPATGVFAATKDTGGTGGKSTEPVQVIAQGRSDLPKVALTFDDGPSPVYTPQILSVLAQYHVHGTFFSIGQQVQQNPSLTRETEQAGNVVGDHTWDHPSLTNISTSQQVSEIEKGATAIKAATGVEPTLLRPPYGNTNAAVEGVTAQQGMATVLWNVDTVDWSRPGVQSIVNTALNNAHNGSIILMHEGGGDRSETVAALPQIIKGLEARGYQLVTVPQLMADMGQAAA